MMKNIEKRMWELTKMGPGVILALTVLAVLMLILWGALLVIKIIAIVILIYTVSETGKRMGYRKGFEDGKRSSQTR